MARVLAIGDLHAPFHHRDSLPFLKEVVDVWGLDTFVCMGDEVDAHNISPSFKPNPNAVMSPTQELKEAKKFLKKMYEEFPEMKVCTSNHTARPFRKAFDAGLPAEYLKSYSEMLEAPEGWEWAHRWEIDGVLYEHGEGFSGMYAHRHAALNRMQSVVIGHVHANAGVSEIAPSATKKIYGMNVGCLVDLDAYAFEYAKNARTKISLGAGVVVEGIPYFVPMVTNKKNRWIGEVIA